MEQRARRQQVAIEQLPFGADFGSLVTLGPKIWWSPFEAERRRSRCAVPSSSEPNGLVDVA